jgi:hypothetical protein
VIGSSRAVALFRSRPWALAGAVLLSALLVAGVVVVHPWGHDHVTASLTQAQDSGAPYPPEATSSSTPSPSATPTPPLTASPTASAGAASGASDSSPDSGDGLGPHPQGSVVVPHTAGQHTWSGTSNGTSIRASISPQDPTAGSPVTFTVHVSGPTNDCCAVYIVFGDGGTTGGTSCPLPTTGGSATHSFTHVYNKPGPHHLLIQAISCHRQDSGELYGTIDIGDGPSTAQGPQLPVVKFSQSTPAKDPEYRTVTLWGQAGDEDGYITKLVVTFGDGTSHTFAGDGNPCTRTTDGWPGPSEATLPYDPAPYAHRYSKPGTYTLRLTAYSAACNGTDVQHASATFTFTAPPPPDQPSSSPTPGPSASPAP